MSTKAGECGPIRLVCTDDDVIDLGRQGEGPVTFVAEGSQGFIKSGGHQGAPVAQQGRIIPPQGGTGITKPPTKPQK